MSKMMISGLKAWRDGGVWELFAFIAGAILVTVLHRNEEWVLSPQKFAHQSQVGNLMLEQGGL